MDEPGYYIKVPPVSDLDEVYGHLDDLSDCFVFNLPPLALGDGRYQGMPPLLRYQGCSPCFNLPAAPAAGPGKHKSGNDARSPWASSPLSQLSTAAESLQYSVSASSSGSLPRRSGVPPFGAGQRASEGSRSLAVEWLSSAGDTPCAARGAAPAPAGGRVPSSSAAEWLARGALEADEQQEEEKDPAVAAATAAAAETVAKLHRDILDCCTFLRITRSSQARRRRARRAHYLVAGTLWISVHGLPHESRDRWYSPLLLSVKGVVERLTDHRVEIRTGKMYVTDATKLAVVHVDFLPHHQHSN